MAVPSSRLAYIDWLRGLACLLMFQTHCYDAWLGGSARLSTFFVWSQLGGTFPAPLFLFLAGTSFAIVIDKLLQKGVAPSEIAKKTIVRGAEIFVLGLLFRLQEYVIALGWAPWSDLFRVDILNTIGVSLMLMGAVCWMVLAITGTTNSRTKLVSAAVLVAAVISALTPLLWTTWQPRFLPWEIETYINGVHNFGVPQAGLFPVFPWTGFAFAGLAFGFLLMSDSVRKLGAGAFLLAAVAGLVLIYGAKFVDTLGWKIYPVYDFWTTSPSFFAIRLGMLLLLVLIAYAWCSWGLGQRGFSPMIQLGNTSLLVYWVHIELVYGHGAWLFKDSLTVPETVIAAILVTLLMLLISTLKTHRDKWRAALEGLGWNFAPRPGSAAGD